MRAGEIRHLLKLDALEQVTHKDNTRGAKAKNYYLVGMACLKLAVQTQSSDPVLYEKASQFFLRAIRYDRSEPGPYLALAQLFILYDRSAKAVPYLQHVLDQDPQHPKALKLRAIIQDQVASSSRPARPAKTTQTEAEPSRTVQRLAGAEVKVADASALEIAHKALEKELKMARRLSQGVKTTHDEEVLHRLEQLRLRLQNKFTALNLEELYPPAEHPVAAMRLEYHGLIEQIDRVIEASSHLVHLQQMLEVLLDEIEDLIDEIEEQPPESGRRYSFQLDQYFERYDALADQLDGLEAESIPIDSLTPMFDQLSQALGDLNEMIQELAK